MPSRREKYASVAFFIISGLQVTSVNISSSLALVVLRSLNVSDEKQIKLMLQKHAYYYNVQSNSIQQGITVI